MNKLSPAPFDLPNAMAGAYMLDTGETCKVILVLTARDMEQGYLSFNATAYQVDPASGAFTLDANHEPVSSNTTPHNVDVTGLQAGTHKIEDGWVRYTSVQTYVKGSDPSTWLIGEESLATKPLGDAPPQPWLSGAGAPDDSMGEVGRYYMDTDTMLPYVKQQGMFELIRQGKAAELGKLLHAHDVLTGLNLPGLV